MANTHNHHSRPPTFVAAATFVRRHAGAVPHLFDQPLVSGFGLATGAGNRLTHPAGRHFQPEGLLEHRRGLAIGQSQALVQLRGQSHRARSQLRRGGAAGVRSLAGMTTLDRPPALLAATEVHAKTNPLHARLRDFSLILVEDVVFGDCAPAMRALRRQLRFQRLIHRRRNRTMAFAPVAVTQYNHPQEKCDHDEPAH